MMMFSDLSFWIFALCVVGFIVGVAVMIKSYRDAKYAAYFFLREEAALRVKRLLLVLVPLAVVIVFLGLRLYGPQPEEQLAVTTTTATPLEERVTEVPTATETVVPTATELTEAPSPTWTMTRVPSLTETEPPAEAATATATSMNSEPTSEAATPTAAATASPTHTLAVTRPSTVTPTPSVQPTNTEVPTLEATGTLTVTPVVTETVSPTPTNTRVSSTVTPSPDVEIGPLVFSRAITPDNRPRNPATVFSPGDSYVYAFFEYHNMRDGVAWAHAWYKDTEKVGDQSGLWPWGSDGRAYIYFSPPNGYRPGRYEVRIFVGDEVKQVGRFEIR